MNAQKHRSAHGAETRENVHNLGRVCAIETRRRFIQKHDSRAHQELSRDAHSALLATRQTALELVADKAVGELLDAQNLHSRSNALLQGAGSSPGRQTQLGVKQEVFIHRRRPWKNIFGCHVTTHRLKFCNTGELTINEDITTAIVHLW